MLPTHGRGVAMTSLRWRFGCWVLAISRRCRRQKMAILSAADDRMAANMTPTASITQLASDDEYSSDKAARVGVVCDVTNDNDVIFWLIIVVAVSVTDAGKSPVDITSSTFVIGVAMSTLFLLTSMWRAVGVVGVVGLWLIHGWRLQSSVLSWHRSPVKPDKQRQRYVSRLEPRSCRKQQKTHFHSSKCLLISVSKSH